MSNSTLRSTGAVGISGNQLVNINATSSTIDCTASALSDVSSSVAGGGMLLVNTKAQFVGALTASTCAGVGINATTSEISIGGAFTASGDTVPFSLSGTRLRAASVTVVGGTTSGATMIAGASLSTTGAISITGTAGVGLSASDSIIQCGGAATVSTSAGSNVALTQTTFTCNQLTASSSTAGSGVILTQARLEVDTSITVSSNALVNLSATQGWVLAGTTANFDGGTAGGVSLTASDLRVVTNLNATGNGTTGLLAARSVIDVGGTVTVHNTTGTCCSLTQSRMSTGGATNTFGVAAATGTKLLLDASTFQAVGTIVANLATGGRGLDLINGSQLTAVTLTLAGNAINLRMVASQASLTGASTSANSSATASVTINDNSVLTSAGTFTVTNSGANIASGFDLHSSRAVMARLDVSGAHTVPLRADRGSTFIVLGTGTSALAAGASSTSVALFEASVVDILNMTATGALGVGNPVIRITGGSTGRLDTVAVSNGADNGLQIDGGSSVKLRAITGTGNTLNGVYVTDSARVEYVTGTMTATGTAGNCKVGVNATKTWANMDTGQLQHVNDFSFPAGIAPALTSVTTSSSCTPGA